MWARYCRLPKKRRGPNGERLCRWCGAAVPPRRQEWCSKRCVDDYGVRSGLTARRQVKERDRGVCCLCGIDCERLRRILRAWGPSGPREGRVRRLLAAMGRPCDPGRKTFWDMDHIIPVSEGGGCCGLENLRTLCCWCHKRETALLASKRSVR